VQALLEPVGGNQTVKEKARDGFVEVLSASVLYQQKDKIYPHIYPLLDIAFASVIDYTDSHETELVRNQTRRQV